MESNLIPCASCNGQGLVSTGANKLDLNAGRTQTCDVCLGIGKVADPKAQESLQNNRAGSDSVTGGTENDNEVVQPKIGDKCLMADGVTFGVLGKNEVGDWVCNPE